MRSIKRFIVILVLLLGALVLTACLGPKPVVRDYAVQPPAQGTDEPYQVDVTVANEGPGGGQIELEVDLVNKQSGVIIAQQTQEVDLQKDNVVQVVVMLDVPESARDLTPDDIKVQVDAHYPIE
ncbi:MAG TPA: hypothetical protein VLQ48_13510 [Chloroflexia bacterium]|nr:hypothetical protein [Chloroflexia bacterium]